MYNYFIHIHIFILRHVFDEFDIHPEKESERKIVDWDRTYFLTKYYCI